MDTRVNLRELFPLSPRKLAKQLIVRSLFLVLFGFVGMVWAIINVASYPDPSRELFSTALIGPWVVVGTLLLAYSGYTRAYIRRYYYGLHDGILVIEKGVLFRRRVEVDVFDLSHIKIDQDPLDKVLGLYNVLVNRVTSITEMLAQINGMTTESASGLQHYLQSSAKTGINDRIRSANSSVVASADSLSPYATEILERLPVVSWMVRGVLAAFVVGVISGVATIVELTNPRGSRVPAAQLWDLSSNEVVLIGVGVLVCAFLISVCMRYLSFRSRHLRVTRDGIELIEGVVFKKQTHLLFSGISNVTVTRGWFDRKFGTAWVIINPMQRGTPMAYSHNPSKIALPGLPIDVAYEVEAFIRAKLAH